jgi:chaperone modulatory protein CbpM
MQPGTILNADQYANAEANPPVSFGELCQSAQIHETLMLKLIECSVVEPIEGARPEEWQFNVAAISDVQKAARIHRDLSVNWEGTALVLSLLDEIAQLKAENEHLRERLNHLLPN